MATPNQPNQGLVTPADYSVVYSRLFDSVRLKTEEVPLELERFFGKRTGNLEDYKEAQNTNVFELPIQSEDSDAIPLFAPAEGWSQTWTSVAYRMGFFLTEDAVTEQKNPMIMQMFAGISDAPRRKKELSCAAMFDDGFTTETTGDGEYIFDTAHKLESAEHGTFSNRAASGGAFTTTTFFAAWLNFQTRKDSKGFPVVRQVAEVAYPVQLEEAIQKVLGSEKYPQNALNAKLPTLFGQFVPVPVHWFSSSDAWFVHANVPEMDRGMIIYDRVPANFRSMSVSENPDIIMGRRMKMAFDVGAMHGDDWYGNPGV